MVLLVLFFSDISTSGPLLERGSPVALIVGLGLVVVVAAVVIAVIKKRK